MMSDLPEYVLDREFDAPRDLVWKAWTDPELVSRWYGPNIETVIHGYDLRAGGEWLNEMKMGGNSMFSKMVFQDVAAPEKLVWHHHSCTDVDWNDVDNPMMPGWPKLLLTTVTFKENGDKTTVRLSQIPMDASDEEIACFAQAMSNMDGGWGAGYRIIDEILAELQ